MFNTIIKALHKTLKTQITMDGIDVPAISIRINDYVRNSGSTKTQALKGKVAFTHLEWGPNKLLIETL